MSPPTVSGSVPPPRRPAPDRLVLSFEITRRTARSAADSWARLTDWEDHTGLIPFTTVSLLPGPAEGVGSTFNARTVVGPVRFNDLMEVTHWQPPTSAEPGICRIVKRGGTVVGWAVLTVAPEGSGALITWREEANFRRAGPFLNWPNAMAGKAVFGKLVDGLLAD